VTTARWKKAELKMTKMSEKRNEKISHRVETNRVEKEG
jgi:hypothetical protein